MKGPIEGPVTALVTGGYKNIGYGISRALKEKGYDVVATFRNDPVTAKRISEEIGVQVKRADMSREEDVRRLFHELKKEGSRVGILVNNVSSFYQGSLMDMSSEKFRESFESCVFSAFYASKASVPHMRALGWGRIINIGMAGAGMVKGYWKTAAHGAAKTSMAVITRSLALELSQYGITVNMINPGMVDRDDRTEAWREDMISRAPSKRLVSIDAISDAVVHTIENRALTGSIIDITNGSVRL